MIFRCPVCGWRHFGKCPLLDLYKSVFETLAVVTVAAVRVGIEQRRADDKAALEHKPE